MWTFVLSFALLALFIADQLATTPRAARLPRVPQVVVTRMGRYRPWSLAFWDFVQLVRVCPRPQLGREGSREAA